MTINEKLNEALRIMETLAYKAIGGGETNDYSYIADWIEELTAEEPDES